MVYEIIKWVLLIIAVWMIVGLAFGVVVGKGIRLADRQSARLHVPAADTHVRAGGRHPLIVRRVD